MIFFKRASIFLLLLTAFLVLPEFQTVSADSLIIRDGQVIFIESEDTIHQLRQQGITPEAIGDVLGTSSEVTATVTVSLFAPTNTPTPNDTPTPTPTSSPSSAAADPSPTPTNTPSPTPIPTVIPPLITVTFETDSGTSQKNVSEILIEDDNGNSIARLALTDDGKAVEIEQNGTEAKTSLPLQIDTRKKLILVKTKNGLKSILLPQDALAQIQKKGSFIIPSSIHIDLEEQGGDIVYVISGKEKAEIFGRFIWELPVTLYVSATTGVIQSTKHSIPLNILQFFRLARLVLQ